MAIKSNSPNPIAVSCVVGMRADSGWFNNDRAQNMMLKNCKVSSKPVHTLPFFRTFFYTRKNIRVIKNSHIICFVFELHCILHVKINVTVLYADYMVIYMCIEEKPHLFVFTPTKY